MCYQKISSQLLLINKGIIYGLSLLALLTDLTIVYGLALTLWVWLPQVIYLQKRYWLERESAVNLKRFIKN